MILEIISHLKKSVPPVDLHRRVNEKISNLPDCMEEVAMRLLGNDTTVPTEVYENLILYYMVRRDSTYLTEVLKREYKEALEDPTVVRIDRRLYPREDVVAHLESKIDDLLTIREEVVPYIKSGTESLLYLREAVTDHLMSKIEDLQTAANIAEGSHPDQGLAVDLEEHIHLQVKQYKNLLDMVQTQDSIEVRLV